LFSRNNKKYFQVTSRPPAIEMAGSVAAIGFTDSGNPESPAATATHQPAVLTVGGNGLA
jgi:hypothetical protein